MVSSRMRKLKRWLAGAAALVLFGANPGSMPWANAQEKKDEIQELRQRLEALEKQNKSLMKLVEVDSIPAGAGSVVTPAALGGDSARIKDLVQGYMAEQDAKKAAVEAAHQQELADEGYRVGSDLNLKARWDPTVAGLRFETANKDFSVHIGTRFQLDNVYFDQSKDIRRAPTPAPGGIGDLQDGIFFRRVRVQAEGTFWQIGEFNYELALESVQQGIVGLDEFWAGVKDIPIVGSVRIGHNKVPQGLEGDMVSSSKVMTFLERAAYTQAFYQNFGTGVWLGNSFLDQHATYSAMAYRQQRGSNGDDFGDGEYGYTARATFLPYYANDGRCLLHLGASGTYREARKPGAGLTGAPTVTFSARPELFDAAGNEIDAYGTAGVAGNSNAFVSTGPIQANSATVYGTELLGILGPLSVQAEYAFAFANDAFVPVRGRNTAQHSLGFNGGYVAVSYFLTGENRQYDRRLGRLNSQYIAQPNSPFYFVKGDDDRWIFARGAWEIAARYSHLDLDNNAIQGGIMDGETVGLNWYLNNNLKIQFDYVHDNRYHQTGQYSGDVNGFGIRTQFLF